MEVLWLTVPISLMLALSFVAFFVWATQSRQWDDLDLSARRNIIDSPQDKKTTPDSTDTKESNFKSKTSPS